MHPKTLGRNIKIVAQKTHLNKRVISHILRYSYAIHLLQSDIDLRSIQKLLGHKSVETTMICTHVVSELNKSKLIQYLEGYICLVMKIQIIISKDHCLLQKY